MHDVWDSKIFASYTWGNFISMMKRGTWHTTNGVVMVVSRIVIMTAIGVLEPINFVLYFRETSESTMPYTRVCVRLSISPQFAANLLQNSHICSTKSMW